MSEKHDIATAFGAGVVKMNVDTGAQWAHWDGIKNFHEAKEDDFQESNTLPNKEGYLQGQTENPEGADKPLRERGARGALQRLWPVVVGVMAASPVSPSCAGMSVGLVLSTDCSRVFSSTARGEGGGVSSVATLFFLHVADSSANSCHPLGWFPCRHRSRRLKRNHHHHHHHHHHATPGIQ